MRSEDSDLIAELHRSLAQPPYWTGFLTRLMARLSAQSASVILWRPDTRAPQVFSVPDTAAMLPAETLQKQRYGRVYSGDDFAHPIHFRSMRLRIDGGAEAWVIVQRAGVDFGASASAALTLMDGNLAVACQRFLNDQTRAVQADQMEMIAQRLQIGWALAEVQFGALVVLASGGVVQGLVQAGRLRLPAQLQRKISDSAAQETASPIALQDQGIQFLALPQPLGRVLIYVQRQIAPLNPSADLLADITGLTPAEARFVQKLVAGNTIAQAGAALSLTAETARYYSKQAYAKLGLAGQTAVVRMVETSVLRLL